MVTEEQKAKLAELRKEMWVEIDAKIDELKKEGKYPMGLDTDPYEIKEIKRVYFEIAQLIKE